MNKCGTSKLNSNRAKIDIEFEIRSDLEFDDDMSERRAKNEVKTKRRHDKDEKVHSSWM